MSHCSRLAFDIQDRQRKSCSVRFTNRHSQRFILKNYALSQQIIDFLTIIKSQPTTHPHYQGHMLNYAGTLANVFNYYYSDASIDTISLASLIPMSSTPILSFRPFKYS